MDWFWHAQMHYLITLIHIVAGIVWLGWVLFIFLILAPKARTVIPEKAGLLQGAVQQRVRKMVLWLILVLLLTGLYNMAYRGLLDVHTLMETAIGHRMLIKLGAAVLVFGIYFVAPFVFKKVQEVNSQNFNNLKAGIMTSFLQKIPLILHFLVVLGILTAAYLGITIGR